MKGKRDEGRNVGLTMVRGHTFVRATVLFQAVVFRGLERRQRAKDQTKNERGIRKSATNLVSLSR